MVAPVATHAAASSRSRGAASSVSTAQGSKTPRRKSCEHPSCPKQPAFSYNGSGVRFCAQHRLDGMVNVRNRRCEGKDCTKEPYFGESGGKARFCATHKPDENMVDVRHRRFSMYCIRKPQYALDMCTAPSEYYSSYQWPQQMNAFSDKICRYKNQLMCDVAETIRKAIFCPSVWHLAARSAPCRRCEYESCTKQPNYGYEGQRACYCSTHKLESMVDVKHRRCAEARCRGYSSYSFPGSKEKFCVEHRREGMVISGRSRPTAASNSTSSALGNTKNDGSVSKGSAYGRGNDATLDPAMGTRQAVRSVIPSRVHEGALPGSLTTRAEYSKGKSVATESSHRKVRGRGVQPSHAGDGVHGGDTDDNIAKGDTRGTKNPVDGEHAGRESSRRGYKRRNGTGSPQDERSIVSMVVDDGVAADDEWDSRRNRPANVTSETVSWGSSRDQNCLPQKGERQRPSSPASLSLDFGLRVKEPAARRYGFPRSSLAAARNNAGDNSPGDLAHRVPHADFHAPKPFNSASLGALSHEMFDDYKRRECSATFPRRNATIPSWNSHFSEGTRRDRDGPEDDRDIFSIRHHSDGSGSGGEGYGSSGASDARGGGYPAALPTPFRAGYNSAGGPPNMGSLGGRRGDEEAVEAGAPVPGGGGGGHESWAEDILASRQLPDIDLEKTRSSASFHPGVQSLSPRSRTPLSRPLPKMSSRWTARCFDDGNSTETRGRRREVRGNGGRWNYSAGRVCRQPWPSPPLVHGDDRVGANSPSDTRAVGSSHASTLVTPTSSGRVPGDVREKNPSVVTIGPKRRLAKFERGTGSLGPTLETLEPNWARLLQGFAIFADR